MTKTRELAESVTEGHPDKVADQISDTILDEVLEQDPDARVACETFVTTGLVLIGGEISTNTYVELQRAVRDTIYEIGYDDPLLGFYYRNVAVLNMIHEQSPDIAQGVFADSPEEQGAGDQGIMYGYAIDETEELMPLPITLAHRLTKKLTQLRKDNVIEYLRPDGKSQVSVRYDDGEPTDVDRITLAAQHTKDVENEKITEDLKEHLIEPVIGEYLRNDTHIEVNGTGQFILGGPHADSGVTGRKNIVDTYGGYVPHGGGAFSGKDPSKVDRTGAYAARYLAKNVVEAGLATKCKVQLAYTIGKPEPFDFSIDTDGTGDDEKIKQMIEDAFDLRPGMIIQRLDLKHPIYKPVSVYGHFGRPELDLPWERTDLFD